MLVPCDGDRDERAVVACQMPVVSGTDENVFRPGPIFRVAEQVVRDLEHGERCDAGGEPREPHQGQPDDEREDAADGGREEK